MKKILLNTLRHHIQCLVSFLILKTDFQRPGLHHHLLILQDLFSLKVYAKNYQLIVVLRIVDLFLETLVVY